MKRNTKKASRALRVVSRNDRGAIERAVKDLFATQGGLMLPILSLVSEARVHIEDALGEVSRGVLEALLQASAEERAGVKTPGRASGEVRWHGTQGGRVALGDRHVRVTGRGCAIARARWPYRPTKLSRVMRTRAHGSGGW